NAVNAYQRELDEIECLGEMAGVAQGIGGVSFCTEWALPELSLPDGTTRKQPYHQACHPSWFRRTSICSADPALDPPVTAYRTSVQLPKPSKRGRSLKPKTRNGLKPSRPPAKAAKLQKPADAPASSGIAAPGGHPVIPPLAAPPSIDNTAAASENPVVPPPAAPSSPKKAGSSRRKEYEAEVPLTGKLLDSVIFKEGNFLLCVPYLRYGTHKRHYLATRDAWVATRPFSLGLGPALQAAFTIALELLNLVLL
ncbi:hypothetical protein FOZ62_023267, partial [Perkinsus olseni]